MRSCVPDLLSPASKTVVKDIIPEVKGITLISFKSKGITLILRCKKSTLNSFDGR